MFDMNRRTLLRAGGMGLLGLNMPGLLRASQPAEGVRKIKARAKSVIFLFQWGGPSHLDMFDMKPEAPDGVRGPYKPVKSSAEGIWVSERLPRMAKWMHKVSLVRSVHHKMSNHNSAGYYAITGHAPPSDDQRLRDSLDLYPAYGSVVDRLGPGKGPAPTFVSYPHVIADGSVTPGQHASFLGKRHDPLFFSSDPNAADFRLPELSLPGGLTPERLEARRKLREMIDEQAKLLDHQAARGLDDYYARAVQMLNSAELRKAFDLGGEKAEARESYGRTTYGQGCLLSRRLVEAGVKFVTVYFDPSIGGQSVANGGWDTHGFNNTRMFPIIEKRHLPITDLTLPTLLEDLEKRGLLDTTLVVWMGEFGRTPKINGNISRDHWPHCYTVLLAGGGVKGGYVHGASDRMGAYPDSDAVTLEDLSATMYYLLGIDPAAEIMDTQNRPLPISSGKPIMSIIA